MLVVQHTLLQNKIYTYSQGVWKNMFLKNSDGLPSGSWTMVWIAFVVVTLWLLISIVSKIGHFEIRSFSSTEAMGYFTPILMNYLARRWTDSKVKSTGSTEEPSVAPASQQ